MTRFADISHHQGGVDLAAYKAAGHDRIVLKATEGTGFTDPAFAARWKRAGELGLARVAYHFARAKFDGADEFDHCYAVVEVAGGLGPRDRLCLDAEDLDTPNRAGANAREFAARAHARGVTEGLVYTYRYYAVNHAIAPSQFPAGWRQLWLADYTAGQADSDIELGAGWTRDQVVARQYTDKATVAGVPGPCDNNRLLRDWLSTHTIPEDTVTPEQMKTILDAINHSTYLLMYGDNADDAKDAKTHPANSQEIRRLLLVLTAQSAARESALLEAIKGITGGSVDLAAIEAAAEKGAADALARVELTVSPGESV